jgi:uncharacterized membrane protein YbhN (UPF0104 family)
MWSAGQKFILLLAASRRGTQGQHFLGKSHFEFSSLFKAMQVRRAFVYNKDDTLPVASTESHDRIVISRALLYRLATYAAAFFIIWFVARGVPLAHLLHSFAVANLWIFIPASVGSFTVWFVGETFLFATLFSYFHRRTSFGEMLPANAAQYFLQLINTAVAGTALVMFMNRRKGVVWLTGGCTLIFQALLDLQIMAAMALIAAAANPSAMIRKFWHVPAIILILLLVNTWFWSRGRPESALGQWVYDRPSFTSFRIAHAGHYLRLGGIRTAIFLAYGLMLYFQVHGFGINVSLAAMFALLPLVLLVDGLPITPVGLGPVQAVLVTGLAAYASRPRLLAMALSVSFMSIAFHAPLGLGSAGTFAREVSSLSKLGRQPV